VPAGAEVEPTEHELRRLRRAVMAALWAEEEPAAAVPRTPRAAAAGRARRSGLRWAAAIAAAAVLAGGGYWTGRGGRGGGLLTPGEVIAGELGRRAAAMGPAGLDGTPFTYSNLQIRPASEDQVTMSFDIASRLELVRPKDDPLVTEVLVGSLDSGGSVGSRLQAIALASDRLDPGVREALVKAMIEDSKVAVRLKALERLSREPRLESAFLEVLRRDESVQMRLLAIDYLTEHRVDPEQLQRALAAAGSGGDTAVRLRARTYLASVTG
jgi:hypothetical protein